MEKFIQGTPPQKPKELILETSEQAELRIQALRLPEIASVSSEIQSQNVDDVSKTEKVPLTASQELLQVMREKTLFHRGNLENVQQSAEQLNIAFDLAKQRGIQIDFQGLDDIAILSQPEYIVVPRLDGTYLYFLKNEDQVFAGNLIDNRDTIKLTFDTRLQQLSDEEALQLREKYQPEELNQLLSDAQAIYMRRNKLKEPTPKKEG